MTPQRMIEEAERLHLMCMVMASPMYGSLIQDPDDIRFHIGKVIALLGCQIPPNIEHQGYLPLISKDPIVRAFREGCIYEIEVFVFNNKEEG